MVSLLSLLFSAGILAFVLRYRVHVHVTYQSRKPHTKPAARASTSRRPAPSPRLTISPIVPTISSALVNLGATKSAARAAAENAVANLGAHAPIDQLLRHAITTATAYDAYVAQAGRSEARA